FGGDIADSHGIGQKERGRGNLFGQSDEDIRRLAHLRGEKVIGVRKVRSELHRRMIRTQFDRQNVEGNRICALFREFVKDTAIKLAGPVEAEMKTHGAVPNGANAIFIDVNEAEIGGDARGKNEGLTSAHVVGNAFESLEKLQPQQTQKTNENNYGEG